MDYPNCVAAPNTRRWCSRSRGRQIAEACTFGVSGSRYLCGGGVLPFPSLQLPCILSIPGPSAVYPAVRQYLTDAFDEGWLSAGHRSEKVIGLVRQTVADLKTKLNVPQDYTVLFTGSATECWEILAQSLTPRRSFHLYNGDFGEKWFKYAQALRPASTGLQFGAR